METIPRSPQQSILVGPCDENREPQVGEGQLRKTLSRGLVRERGEVAPVHSWGGRARVGSHRPGEEPARAERYPLDRRESV